MQGDREEASRVIFMGWPGQHELEDDRAAHRPHDADGMTGSGLLQLVQTCLASHPFTCALTCRVFAARNCPQPVLHLPKA